MAASRDSGRRLLTIIRNVQQQGAAETLRQLNLAALAGQPAENFFVAIVEFLCPPGGALDESIAREAMFDTIRDLADAELGSFDQLTPAQLNELFVDFVARSIEGRVINDIGARGITLPADAAACENVAEVLHNFVSGCTREALIDRMGDLTALSDAQISGFVLDIYEAAFELVVITAENEE